MNMYYAQFLSSYIAMTYLIVPTLKQRCMQMTLFWPYLIKM